MILTVLVLPLERLRFGVSMAHILIKYRRDHKGRSETAPVNSVIVVSNFIS
jgi:hypothetical protein